MRVNISVEDNLLKSFDEFCVKYRFERSEFISALMRATDYDDFTLKGARIVVRKVQGQEEVKPQEVPQSENGTPKKLDGERVWRTRNLEDIYASMRVGKCDNHYWDKVIFPKTYHICYENEDGKRTIDKWLCPKCKDNVINLTNEKGVILPTWQT